MGKLFFGLIGTCDLEVDREPGYEVDTRRNGAVNRGLRAIGVHAAPGTDEYESVGLTRHRMIEDWAALSGHELHDAFTEPANHCAQRGQTQPSADLRQSCLGANQELGG